MNRPVCGISQVSTNVKRMNRPVCGISLEILGPFVGSAHLWESAPFVGLTLFVSLTYIQDIAVYLSVYRLGSKCKIQGLRSLTKWKLQVAIAPEFLPDWNKKQQQKNTQLFVP